MLYLAEVQKQKGGLLSGSGKTELKLLACQRNDQSWSQVSEEVIAADEASKLNDGVLVLVELTPNRQLQRIQEAGRPLINILQNFSRQLEKFKVKEEEIDQWKQSLTFQAQELNRREMDMEARLEQLQQMEEEFQRCETQKQEVETAREEIEKLKTEIERNRQELEGAWEHLRGEQRRLEEQKAECQQGTVLDEEQTRVLNDVLTRLSTSVAPTETVREDLNLAFELVEKQQAVLNPHWEKLEQQKTAVEQQQTEVDRIAQILCDRRGEWEQAQGSLEQQIAELKVNTVTLTHKQEYAQNLKKQLQYQQELYQQVNFLAAIATDVPPTPKVDIAALEKMSVEQLQETVRDLQQKLNIDSSFVNEQEQELKEKQKTIEELQRQINQVSESDRSKLQTELVDEQDLYQMLNETLVGQRRSLSERLDIFKQHQIVLLQRQGKPLTQEILDNKKTNLQQVIVQIERQRQQYLQELQNVEREIEQIRANIEKVEDFIDKQSQQQQIKRQELQILEQNLQSLQTATMELRGQLHLYNEALQPIQDCLDGLRNKLQGITESLTKVQETSDYQLQNITQMCRIMNYEL
ncbi:MAG: pilus motility taxis protein HmpF [Scytonema sp. PMC 1069.18]|nr:pilus motility taxis protein HmpF [Scytonema sp. PMC 1069.18]MEC4883457.1 pilus motility taxis protein HmpF [Scytonema sp. PMC 1070.18]